MDFTWIPNLLQNSESTITKVWQGFQADSSTMVGSSSFPIGIRKNAEMNTRTSSLKVSKDSHRIRKPSLPLPQVQYRPPIIIHTYSPKVIHTQPDDFMSLVQKLTGSSDTRLRLKRSNSTSKSTSTKSKDVHTNLASEDDQAVADRQSDVNPAQGQALKSTTLCGSPCSSEESNFLALEGSGDPNSSMKQSDSPRGPLSNYEFDTDAMISFSSLHAPPSTAHIFSHVKPEPSFPAMFNDMTSFNFFSTTDVFSQSPASSLKSPSKCSSSSMPSRQLDHQMINPFLHHIDINSPSLPSGFYSSSPDHQLSPTLTSRLCGNSSSQSMFLDPISSSSASSYMNLAAPIPRQRYAAGGYCPAPEAGTMVSLENIQAFMFS